jgi:beta-xylosidase
METTRAGQYILTLLELKRWFAILIMFNRRVFCPFLLLALLSSTGVWGKVVLHSDRTGNLFRAGEPLDFVLTTENGEEPFGAELTISLTDYSEHLIGSQTVAFPKRDQRPVLPPLSWPAPGPGFYRIRVQANGQSIAETTLGVLAPVESSPAAEPSQFGTIAHLKHMTDSERTKVFELLSLCGIGWVREGFLWHELEPQRGQWHWERYDDIVDRAGKFGISVLPVLCFTADWASSAPEEVVPEKRRRWAPQAAEWAGYVRAIVGHYKDRIHAWEVWNEPNLPTFWQPKPEAKPYAQLLENTYRVAKEVSPDATLISAGLATIKTDHPDRPENYEEKYVSAMVHQQARPFDAIGYHPYTLFNHSVSNAQTVRRFENNIHNLLVGLPNTPDGERTPLWFTEMGTSTIPRIVSESRAAEYLVVMLTCALSTPHATRFFWYNFRDVGVNPEEKEDMFGLIHADYTPKPGYLAYRTFIAKMNQASFVGKSDQGGVCINKFSRAGRNVWVAWADDAPVETELETETSAVKITDVVGTSTEQMAVSGKVKLRITSSPVFIEFLPSGNPTKRPTN